MFINSKYYLWIGVKELFVAICYCLWQQGRNIFRWVGRRMGWDEWMERHTQRRLKERKKNVCHYVSLSLCV
jgi:hypothetical protein